MRRPRPSQQLGLQLRRDRTVGATDRSGFQAAVDRRLVDADSCGDQFWPIKDFVDDELRRLHGVASQRRLVSPTPCLLCVFF